VRVAQEYATQGKKQPGAVRAYIVKVTGMSLSQATRPIRKYRAEGVVEAVPHRRFPVKYSSQDVARLVEVDRAHGWLSGPATMRIFPREHQQYGKAEYARLGAISVAHLYNLRGSARYRKLAAKWKPARPVATVIAERRQPDPRGQPGYLRIDTVHQADWNGVKGVLLFVVNFGRRGCLRQGCQFLPAQRAGSYRHFRIGRRGIELKLLSGRQFLFQVEIRHAFQRRHARHALLVEDALHAVSQRKANSDVPADGQLAQVRQLHWSASWYSTISPSAMRLAISS
jgi:hypothetical protein